MERKLRQPVGGSPVFKIPFNITKRGENITMPGITWLWMHNANLNEWQVYVLILIAVVIIAGAIWIIHDFRNL